MRERLLASRQVIQRQDFGSGHAFNIDQEPTLKTTTVSRLCKVAGTPAKQARLLYYLVKELQPQKALELGTCLGISAAYQLAAKSDEGRFVTIEGDPETARLAQQNLDSIGLTGFEVKSGPFAQVLPGVLEALQQVDYVLIDGHHDGGAMQQYFAMIRPYLSVNACVVFDDIDWSESMYNAWRKMRLQYNFLLALDLGRIGIVIV